MNLLNLFFPQNKLYVTYFVNSCIDFDKFNIRINGEILNVKK